MSKKLDNCPFFENVQNVKIVKNVNPMFGFFPSMIGGFICMECPLPSRGCGPHLSASLSVPTFRHFHPDTIQQCGLAFYEKSSCLDLRQYIHWTQTHCHKVVLKACFKIPLKANRSWWPNQSYLDEH